MGPPPSREGVAGSTKNAVVLEKKLGPNERSSVAKAELGPNERKAEQAASADKAKSAGPEPKTGQNAGRSDGRTSDSRAQIAAAPPRAAAAIVTDLKRTPAKKSADDDRKRALLIGELYRADPANRLLPVLMVERWMTLRDDPNIRDERTAAAGRKSGDPLGNSAAYVATLLAIEDPGVGAQAARKSISAYASRAQVKRSSVAELLGKLADEKIESVPDKKLIYNSIIEKFSETPAAEVAAKRLAKIDRDKLESIVDPFEAATNPRIGKVIEFAFEDAVSGAIVSSANLRGHVMVIDFWATWCQPCVEAMPTMKELYAKYAREGVVFIGVSHDEPGQQGLQKLLGFVAEHQIPWAQYYQPNRELSKAWGVAAIPSVFVVDQEGRIVTTEGDIDEVVGKLIEDSKTATSPLPARRKSAKRK
jgi:thiol-disulfide isomerase/thioredoxin